jgi:uncharacterized repeat protein (TIGR02543 family)
MGPPDAPNTCLGCPTRRRASSAKLFLPGGKIMHKKAWFFKNKTVVGILGAVLVFGMLATGCPTGNDDPPVPTTYVVTFDTDEGSPVPNQTVEEGKTVAKPANPTKADNTFANWYRNEAKTVLWNFDTDVVVADTTIYAKWAEGENVASYEVTFNVDGGTPAPPKQPVVKDEPVQEPAKPTKPDHIFGGWYIDPEGPAWNFATDTVTEAITLTAKWIGAVTVTFETNGGSDIAPVTVANGGSVYPSNYQPTKPDNVFDGWYTDAEFSQLVQGTLTVTQNTTLYAKWTATATLADYAGVWRYGSGDWSYLLQGDGTAWVFVYSSPHTYFYKDTWSTSRIAGHPGTFDEEEKTQFTTSAEDGSITFTKNTNETKSPTAATDPLLGVWVYENSSIELKSDKTAVVTDDGNTITLNYCAEGSAVYLLTLTDNLVIFSIDITDGKLAGFSKPTTDNDLAGIWKLTENGQDYYWNLNANGSGTFHTLGASVPVSFIVTEDGEIAGRPYTVSENGNTTLTFSGIDLVLTKVAGVGSGSGAGGDDRLHGTWKDMEGGSSVTFDSKGVVDEDSIWKADGSNLYIYGPYFSERGSSPTYSISGSTLTIKGSDYERVFTKQ